MSLVLYAGQKKLISDTPIAINICRDVVQSRDSAVSDSTMMTAEGEKKKPDTSKFSRTFYTAKPAGIRFLSSFQLQSSLSFASPSMGMDLLLTLAQLLLKRERRSIWRTVIGGQNSFVFVQVLRSKGITHDIITACPFSHRTNNTGKIETFSLMICYATVM